MRQPTQVSPSGLRARHRGHSVAGLCRLSRISPSVPAALYPRTRSIFPGWTGACLRPRSPVRAKLVAGDGFEPPASWL